MSKHVKVDIIIESIKLDHLIDILEALKVPGYTIVGNVSGCGENGVKRGDGHRARIFENSYLFIICTEEMSKQLLKAINIILKDYSGACFVTDISGIEMYHRS
jgi:nitrogen regulatory protein PII